MLGDNIFYGQHFTGKMCIRDSSKPKRGLICVLFTFLGGFAGVGTVLALPFVANVLGNDKLKRFIKE